MALKNMTYSLYSKIALWLVLNLVLLAVLGFGIGWYVLLGNGLVPAHFFSSNIENSFRLVSVNLQYRSVFTWQKLLKQYDRGEALRFHLRSLETGVLYDDCIPEKVIQAAMAIPKSSFTLCPDPDMQLWDSLRGGFFDTQQRNMEAGLPPIPPAIFVRTHSPARYWYGRVLYIPDKNHQLHYVLLALETDSFYGYGLFFEFRGVLLVILAVLGVSCLWWWPFVRHLSRPLLKMVHYAERVEMDNFVCLDKALSDTRTFSGERRDEIGRLGHAFMTMTRRVGLLISGQSQFIPRGSACPSSNTAWKHVAGGSNTRTPNRRDFAFPCFSPRAKVPCSVKCAGSRTAPSYSVSPSPGTLRIKDWVRAKVFEGGGG